MKGIFSGVLSYVVMGAILMLFMLFFFNRYIVPVLPVILAVIVYFFTKTQRTLIKKKLTPIYELTEGLVKIEGRASALSVFESPFFKEECIGYSYEQAKIAYDDETGSEYTVSAVQSDKCQDFYLTNSTGKIKVIANRINFSFLQKQVKVVGNIKHTERTLKNADVVSVLGNAIKNNKAEFELQKLAENPFVVSNEAIISKQQKAFRAIKFLLPYIVLMYIGVNYFLFFAPIKIQMEKNTAFILFSFFGMPILAVVLGLIGNRMEGFGKLFFSNLAGICFGVTLLTFPLLCLFFTIELEFYRIVCIWITVLVCNTLAFVTNFKRLDGLFKTDTNKTQ